MLVSGNVTKAPRFHTGKESPGGLEPAACGRQKKSFAGCPLVKISDDSHEGQKVIVRPIPLYCPA